MRRLASSVLVFEALVVVFAMLVALAVQDADPTIVGVGAGTLVVGAIVITAFLRYRWAYVAGSILQVLLIASGALVSVMYFLGALFAGLWMAAIWLGSRANEAEPH